MYNETRLNQRKLNKCDKFDDRIKRYSPKSKSYHNHNQHLSNEELWNVPGGTAISIDENMCSHKVRNGNGQDKKYLGRWTCVLNPFLFLLLVVKRS